MIVRLSQSFTGVLNKINYHELLCWYETLKRTHFLVMFGRSVG